MRNKPKIVFFGTPQFSVPTLELLCQKGFEPALVVTQKDKAVGRKQALAQSPVKSKALALGLKVSTSLNNEALANLNPDLGIVVAYGKIIPKKILDLFDLGVLNLHPSCLPKYRGPSPIQSALLANEKITCVSIIKLDEQMDHGPIVRQESWPITADDDYPALSQKLAVFGAKVLVNSLADYLSSKIVLIDQDDSEATYSKLLTRDSGKIDWHKDAAVLAAQIRAYAGWPENICMMDFGNQIKKVKIISSRAVSLAQNLAIGQIILENENLIVACAKGGLKIEKLQIEGKKIITAKEFLNGYGRNFKKVII